MAIEVVNFSDFEREVESSHSANIGGIIKDLVYLETNEWNPGEVAWLPPDDFLGGEWAELEPHDLPPHLGSVALREPGKPEVALAA
jgi:hypothetical protein